MNTELPLSPPPTDPDGTATDRVYEAIYLAVLEHRLAPGEWLREAELATEFKVSRTVVRQALQRRAQDQVIELRHNRGARVPLPSLEDAARLSTESDFRPYMSRGVAPEVRNAAMKKLFAVALIAAFASNVALADAQCKAQPKDKWQKEADFKKKLTAEGYQIKKFKVTGGNCYEIYGKDKAGRKVEIYYDPTDGRVVKERDDD